MFIDKNELENISKTHLQITYEKFELENKGILERINNQLKQDILDLQTYSDLTDMVKKETYKFKQQLCNYLSYCQLNLYTTFSSYPYKDIDDIRIKLTDFYF